MEKIYFSSPKRPDRKRAHTAQGEEISLFSKEARQEIGPTQPKEKRYFSSPKRPDRNRAHPAQGKEIFLFSKEARQE